MKNLNFLFLFVLIVGISNRSLAQTEQKQTTPSTSNTELKNSQINQSQQILLQFESERLKALKNDGIIDSKEESTLSAIAAQNIETTQSNYLLARLYRNSQKSKIYLDKISEPNNALVEAERAWQSISEGDYNQAKKFTNELVAKEFISKEKVMYGQLIKQSILDESFLITNGEWDTYAALSAVNKSIVVIPLPLLAHPDFQAYLKKLTGSKITDIQDLKTTIQMLAAKRNVYVSLTVQASKLKPNASQLSLSGVCVKWNPNSESSNENELFYQSLAFKQLNKQLKQSNSKDLAWFRNVLPGLKSYELQLIKEQKNTNEVNQAIQLIQNKTADNE